MPLAARGGLTPLALDAVSARAGVTRQAVFDSLRRSVVELRWLEERLGVLADRRRRTRARAAAIRRLTAVEREVARLAASRPADLSPIRGALRALRAQL